MTYNLASATEASKEWWILNYGDLPFTVASDLLTPDNPMLTIASTAILCHFLDTPAEEVYIVHEDGGTLARKLMDSWDKIFKILVGRSGLLKPDVQRFDIDVLDTILGMDISLYEYFEKSPFNSEWEFLFKAAFVTTEEGGMILALTSETFDNFAEIIYTYEDSIEFAEM